MDDYIKREDAIKAITWNGLSEPPEIIHLTLLTAQKNIRRISAADVVPKSEVERLEAELEDKQFRCDSCDRIMLTGSEHRACVKQAKAEVAREIFEELENVAKIYTFPVVRMGVIEIVKEPFWCIEPDDFTKLKKKYTEEKK